MRGNTVGYSRICRVFPGQVQKIQNPILKPQKSDGVFRFASIWECMIELAPVEAANKFRISFVGDTFNTAWYMCTLRPDVETRYITHVGTDAVSNDMLDMMTGAGINTSHIVRTAERSVGLYLISLKNGERSFSYWRDKSAARELAKNPASLIAATKGVDLIYFSGITLAILSQSERKTLLEVLAAARARGATIAFNSNLRPRLWDSVDEMKTSIMKAASVSDIILPSYDDEVTFFKDNGIEETEERYLKGGAKTIVVKNGAGSVYYVCEGVSGYVKTQVANQLIDTTSAGDSFNAGFIAGLDRHKASKT